MEQQRGKVLRAARALPNTIFVHVQLRMSGREHFEMCPDYHAYWFVTQQNQDFSIQNIFARR